MSEKLLMTLKEASEFLGIPKATLHSLAWQKKIPHIRIGRRRYFLKEDLIQWIEKHKHPVMPKTLLTRKKSLHTIIRQRKWAPDKERR